MDDTGIEALDIYTDDSCNLSREWLAAHGVGLLPLSVMLDGKECPDEMRDDPTAFYEMIRKGARPSTGTIPTGLVETMFGRSLECGRDILYIGLPAKLSSNFRQVQDMVKRFAAGCRQKICCMDSRSATMGHGMLVEEAVRLRGEGRQVDVIHGALEKLSDHIRILFMLDDPRYLKAGGRGEEALEWVARFISKLKIKPVLTINLQCAIKFHSVSRSRKNAMSQMMEYLHTTIDTARDQVVHVAHADIPRLAEAVADAVQKTLGAQQKVTISEVPPVLGAHVGPGTVALIFLSSAARS
jgi:DegV family protein with EDD domain